MENLEFILNNRITFASQIEIADNSSWITAIKHFGKYYRILVDLCEI